MAFRTRTLKLLSSLSLALPAGLVAGTSLAAIPVGTTGSIVARVDNEYVCADNAGASSLVASRAVPGPWEKFQVIDLGGGNVALRSLANNLYVCAENAGNSPLIANRGSVGPWETFHWIDLGAGELALQAAVNGLYVTAEDAGASALIANRTGIGPWETFHWVAEDQALCPVGSQIYGEWAGGFCCDGTLGAGAGSCYGNACALDPTQTQGAELCYEETSPRWRAMGAGANYGNLDGGFCCDGSLGAGKDTCNGNVCALDPAQSQGNALCAPMQAECPAFMLRYGEWAGGFCCDGEVGAGADTCNGNVCALDPARSQGNPLCAGFVPPPQGTQNGVSYFSTKLGGGAPFHFAAASAAVVATPSGVSIIGDVTVGADGNGPGITLGNADITLTFDAGGYVDTLIGTASVSMPSSGDLAGLTFDDLGTVTLGLDWGVNLKDPANPQHVDAPMQDDRQYLVYHVATGLAGSYGAVQISVDVGSETLIVADPRDPSVYFHGDMSQLTGLSALDDVGLGLSVQGLLAFEHDYTWGIEGFATDFDGNLVVEGGAPLPLTTLPLALDGQIMVRMPTSADPVTHLGLNGGLNVDVGFVPGVSFTLPIGEASASAHLGQTQQDAYFSGRVYADLAQILPTSLPIGMGGQIRAAGRLSSNVSDSFLMLQGAATVDGFGLSNALLTFNSAGVGIQGQADLPGFSLDVAGTAGSGSASLAGTVSVHIPIHAPKTIVDVVDETVYYTSNGVECGYTTVADGVICGYDTVTSGTVCGYENVTSGAICGWTSVASWFCQTFGCAAEPATCQVMKTCSVPKTCDVANSCSKVVPYTSTYVDQNYHYGDYYGTIQVGIATGSGLTGSLSGQYCPVSGVCTAPASARIEDLGGPGAKACATVSPFGEICADL